MRRVDDELRDEVFFTRFHAKTTSATTPLLPINRDRRALQIASVRHRHRDLLVGDEIFELQLGRLINDLRTTSIAILVANLGQLLHDYLTQLRRRSKNRLKLSDVVTNFRELLKKLVDGKLSQTVELQFEDSVDLLVAENQCSSG